MKLKYFFLFLVLFIFYDVLAVEKTYDIKPQHSEIDLKNFLGDVRSSELFTIAISSDFLNYKIPSFIGEDLKFVQDFISVEVGKRNDNNIFKNQGFWELSIAFKKFARDYGPASQGLYLYQLNFLQNFYIPNLRSNLFRLSLGAGLSPVYLTSEKSVLSNSLSALGILALGKMTLHYYATQKYQLILSFQAGIGAADSKNIGLSSLNFGVCFE